MNRQKWSRLAAAAALCLISLLLSGQPQPAFVDADHDGIPDDWEVNGVTVTTPDGHTQTLDLKGRKASPGHKDIIVWVDWMADQTHSHKPRQSAIDLVVNAFAGAAQFHDNPDHSTGINLIVLVSPTPVPHVDRLGDGQLDNTVWRDYFPIRDSHMPAKLKGVAHYCLFAHDIDDLGTSGLSYDFGSYDFIVSLGQWQDQVGNETEQAGTFMHELGHNLGLRHGGMDDLQYKPNYLSVMNYFFQTDGLSSPTDQGSINYSTFQFPDLNESNLDENQPLTNDARWTNWGTAFFCLNDKQHSRIILSMFGALVDWNCNGTLETGISADLNGDDTQPSIGIDNLRSQVDWTNLKFIFPPPPAAGTPAPATSGELNVSSANLTPLPPAQGISALTHGTTVGLSWNRVFSSRVRGYEVDRIVPNERPLVFVTTSNSYTDNLAHPVPRVRYEIRTLFVPHGAANLVKVTGRKLQERWDLLAVGKTQKIVPMLLADRTAVRELQRTIASDWQSLSHTLLSSGGTRAAVAELNSRLQQLGSLLMSQPATVEVQFQ